MYKSCLYFTEVHQSFPVGLQAHICNFVTIVNCVLKHGKLLWSYCIASHGVVPVRCMFAFMQPKIFAKILTQCPNLLSGYRELEKKDSDSI